MDRSTAILNLFLCFLVACLLPNLALFFWVALISMDYFSSSSLGRWRTSPILNFFLCFCCCLPSSALPVTSLNSLACNLSAAKKTPIRSSNKTPFCHLFFSFSCSTISSGNILAALSSSPHPPPLVCRDDSKVYCKLGFYPLQSLIPTPSTHPVISFCPGPQFPPRFSNVWRCL